MIGNEPAFPQPKEAFILFSGMTIRQYFVAQAMLGLLYQDAVAQVWTYPKVAELAVKQADACLAREAETREG